VGAYASVNSVDIYYEVHRRGRPLVLIHGPRHDRELLPGSAAPHLTSYSELLRDLGGICEAGGRLRSDRQQKDAYLQAIFYGSDGTRTRHLRRDRPAFQWLDRAPRGRKETMVQGYGDLHAATWLRRRDEYDGE
jgi:hypothetical protein